LRNRGVFNGFVDLDSKLYVDPFLLRTADTPELRGAYDEYRAHFVQVLLLLRKSTGRDALFRRASDLLTFKELPLVALGYSQGGITGSGIGVELAGRLAQTAKEIIGAGVEDPAIFDLVGLIEENVGADRISDMVTRIVMPRLLKFSNRIARELQVDTTALRFDGQNYLLPKDPRTGKPILLLPGELLRTLPVARDWSDVDRVAAENSQLRRQVNRVIGSTWKQATRRVKKAELRAVLLRYPQLLRELLEKYSRKRARPYDFDRDPEGLFSWFEIGSEFATNYPLRLVQPSTDELLELVRKICQRFGELVENNGLAKMFYSQAKRLRHEQFAQLLFYAVADAYCAANNLMLTRETNAGRGAVDFKIGSGYSSSLTVEIKYTSNKQLVRGFTKQLPTYAKAEGASDSIYLVLRTTASDSSIKALRKVQRSAKKAGQRVPDVLVFDARLRPSASKS
jgi:hypothetical protein